jgi:type 1 glutamine amidotransferase
MAKKALIVAGGWEGHQPRQVGAILERILNEDGFDVEVSNSLDSFTAENLQGLSLIVPIWTMGNIEAEPLQAVLNAVEGGVGMAGCHGGMCDAFRTSTGWQFLTGGQWVAHPGNSETRYTVKMTDEQSPITAGIDEFEVVSEQYYLHIDPAIKVLATTQFPVADGPHVPNGQVEMPVVWTKLYGKGRVFYNSLGHQAATVEMEPVLTLMRRGCQWAAGGSEA